MASSPRSPWKPEMSYHRDTEQRFIPKEQKGEGKEKIQSTCFLNGEFLEVRTGFHTETMARVHPAAFSLLLSLPILRLSICLWAETHGTSCSTRHTSQEFTSCSSALLLHTSPIPRTCINSPPYAQTAQGHTNRQANASPFYGRTSLPPFCLSYTLMRLSKFSNSAHPTEMFSHYLALSSCTDLEWQWKQFVLF